GWGFGERGGLAGASKLAIFDISITLYSISFFKHCRAINAFVYPTRFSERWISLTASPRFANSAA
ncbi:hypothetical protein, partial [Burkholderia sp. SRS-W-2-2016]|uniref:hypothetical protein n=1 Tax=Burkholderia sp. SRS-W-2-2016 TaxID=1926878 RepID=UPI001C4BEDCF